MNQTATSGAANDTPGPSAMPLQSEAGSPDEPGMQSNPPKKRPVPCLSCLEHQSVLTPVFCMEGERPDTCAACSEGSVECEKVSGTEFRHFASKLQDALYENADKAVITQHQRVIHHMLRDLSTHKALIKGFHHGVKSLHNMFRGRLSLTMLGGRLDLTHELRYFNRGAEGMARLLLDDDNADDFRRSVCFGAEVGADLARDEERHVRLPELRLGAQAIASLFLKDDEDYSVEVTGFCRGVEGAMGLIDEVDDDRASILRSERS